MSDRPLAPVTERKVSAAILVALGDETRLALIARLCEEQPLSMSRLIEGTGLTRQTVTKHLHVVKDVGAIRSVCSGRESLFAFEPGAFERAKTYLDQVSEQWDKSLAGLKCFVEDCTNLVDIILDPSTKEDGGLEEAVVVIGPPNRFLFQTKCPPPWVPDSQ